MTKLIQLNMWGGRIESSLKDFFAAEKPDIICLQEAISYTKRDAAFFFTIEQLQEMCALPYAAFAPMFTFRLMNGTALSGNCILSHFPIQKSETVFTRLRHTEDFDFNEHDYNVRNFLHTKIAIKGDIYHVLTHHGHHVPGHKDGDEETLRQMNILAEYIDQLEGNIILAGDFNLAPHSPSLELINKRLANHSVAHKLRTTRTALTHKTEVCDYIFTSKDIKAKNFRAADDLISDHEALIMEF